MSNGADIGVSGQAEIGVFVEKEDLKGDKFVLGEDTDKEEGIGDDHAPSQDHFHVLSVLVD